LISEEESMTDPVVWPQKRRELQNHHLDSRAWNEFPFRDGDVIIATYAKSGTTWVQQIVGQLIFGGDPALNLAEVSPWLDMRLRIPEKLARLAAQTHRRFIKTHLPADALVISPQARYLYVGRDGRDVVWSFYHHHRSHVPQYYDRVNSPPRARRSSLRATPGRHSRVLARLAGSRRLSLLVVLGERAPLVGHP
jgi:aryl sulfotransferase